MKLLSTADRVCCCHGGVVQLRGAPRFRIGPGAAVRCSDLEGASIVGCTQTGKGEKPCEQVVLVLSGVAPSLKVDGGTPVLAEFVALTEGRPPGTCRTEQAMPWAPEIRAATPACMRAAGPSSLADHSGSADAGSERQTSSRGGFVLDIEIDLGQIEHLREFLPSWIPLTVNLVQGGVATSFDVMLARDGPCVRVATALDPALETWAVATSALGATCLDQFELARSEQPFVAAQGDSRLRVTEHARRWQPTYARMLAQLRRAPRPDWRALALANGLDDDERRLPAWKVVRVPLRLANAQQRVQLLVRPSFPHLCAVVGRTRELASELAGARLGLAREDVLARAALASLCEELSRSPSVRSFVEANTAAWLSVEDLPRGPRDRPLRTWSVHELMLDAHAEAVDAFVARVRPLMERLRDALLPPGDEVQIQREIATFREGTPYDASGFELDAPAAADADRARAARTALGSAADRAITEGVGALLRAMTTIRQLELAGRPAARMDDGELARWSTWFERCHRVHFLSPGDGSLQLQPPRLWGRMRHAARLVAAASTVEFVADTLESLTPLFEPKVVTGTTLLAFAAASRSELLDELSVFIEEVRIRGVTRDARELYRIYDDLERFDHSYVYGVVPRYGGPDAARRAQRRLQGALGALVAAQFAAQIAKRFAQGSEPAQWDAIHDLLPIVQDAAATLELGLETAAGKLRADVAANAGELAGNAAQTRGVLQKLVWSERAVDAAKVFGKISGGLSLFLSAHILARELFEQRYGRVVFAAASIAGTALALFGGPELVLIGVCASVAGEALLFATSPDTTWQGKTIGERRDEFAQLLRTTWLGREGWQDQRGLWANAGHLDALKQELLRWRGDVALTDLQRVRGFLAALPWSVRRAEVVRDRGPWRPRSLLLGTQSLRPNAVWIEILPTAGLAWAPRARAELRGFALGALELSIALTGVDDEWRLELRTPKSPIAAQSVPHGVCLGAPVGGARVEWLELADGRDEVVLVALGAAGCNLSFGVVPEDSKPLRLVLVALEGYDPFRGPSPVRAVDAQVFVQHSHAHQPAEEPLSMLPGVSKVSLVGVQVRVGEGA